MRAPESRMTSRLPNEPPHPRGDQGPEAGLNCGHALPVFVPIGALGRDLLPNGDDDSRPAVILDEPGVGRLVDQRPYSRQGRSPVRPGIPYPAHMPVEIRLAGW